MSNNYTPYHVHTDYSLLDSSTHYDEYVQKAVEQGMKAIAFSEHGKISGWVKKKNCCDEHSIKYIHAVEIYLTEKLEPKVRDNYHTVLIARNYKGVQEINSIVSKSFNPDHFYYANRITFQEFLSLSNNVITTSACLASPLNKLDVTHPMYKKLIERYDYLEIQPHKDGDQVKFNQHLAMLAEEYKKPLIAGTDTHSLNQYKAECRKILLAYKKQSYGNEDDFDLTWKSYDELVNAFEEQGALPSNLYMEAIENTNRMADMVEDWSLDCSLKYPILYKDRQEDHEKLVESIEEKFKYKVDNGIIPQEQVPAFRAAIDEEVKVFTKIQMDGFMLSMEELLTWCRENGIVTGPARGSVGGSRVAYITDIIDLNPETWHTVFSRFANEDRVEVGDIDVDVIESDRPRIFEHIKSRFGVDKTARVASFGTIADKGAVDVIVGGLRETYKKQHQCGDNETPYTLKFADEIKNAYAEDPAKAKEKYKEVFYYFDGLLGCKVSQSVHPAGMVIAPITLADNYGVFDKEGDLCLFLDMDEAHHVGLVKYDFLVLKTVGMIKSICENAGIPYPKSHEVNWNDQKVWEDMTKDPVGIFQMESAFSFELLTKFKPKSIFDLSLVTAAVRPSGASYRDDLCAHKIHKNPSKEIDEILKNNNGFLVYQEDVIKFLQQACGLTGSEADNVRRGIAKKRMEILDKAMPKIVNGYCERADKPREEAEKDLQQFLQVIKDASDYMFGYNHSVAYCLLSYLCAYLRYYYPKEFIAGYLNFAANADDIKNGTELAKAYNVRITPPKYGVSRGGYAYDKEAGVIAKGLSSIKYLSSDIADSLYNIAHNDNPQGFSDMLVLSGGKGIDTRQMTILININFFERFGTVPKLARIYSAYQLFYKQGKPIKSMRKDKVGNGDFAEIVKSHSTYKTKTGKEAASYTFATEEDVVECLRDCERHILALPIHDLSLKDKIQNSIDYLGYCDVQTGDPKDRRKLIIGDVHAKRSNTSGAIWAYSLDVQSLGTGKASQLTVLSRMYDKNPIKKGDIVYCKNIYKNERGYWYMNDWSQISS